MKVSFGIFISILVSILVLFDLVSIALTTAAITNAQSPDETLIAFLCSAVTMGLSFLVLLFVTLPACICSLRKRDNSESNDCCTPTYFVSVVVAGIISVIGAYVTGFTQIFAAYIYEDVKSNDSVFSLIQGAAAFNFIAALFGTCMIFITLCTCMSKGQNWQYCRQCPPCNVGTIIAFLFVPALVTVILVASLLTMFMSFYTTIYSNEHGESPNYSRATVATLFSFGAAGCLLVGLCIGGPMLCYMPCQTRKEIIKVTSIVMCVWALLTSGTLIAGGLMMKVGQSFAVEETLDPDENLIREPISAQGYLIGTLNFVVVLVAILLTCCGIFFWNSKKFQEEDKIFIVTTIIETTYTVQKGQTDETNDDYKEYID